MHFGRYFYRYNPDPDYYEAREDNEEASLPVEQQSVRAAYYSPQRGEVFADVLTGEHWLALSENFILTFTPDGRRMLSRPMTHRFHPVSVGFYELPDMWGIDRDVFNSLVENYPELQLEPKTPTEEKLDRIIWDLENTQLSPKQAAKKHGLALNTVRIKLRQLDKQDLYDSSWPVARKLKLVLEDIEEGIHPLTASQNRGINVETVRRHLRDRGQLSLYEEALEATRPVHEMIDQVIEDLEEGLTPRQAAEKHNTTLQTIRRHMRERGQRELYEKATEAPLENLIDLVINDLRQGKSPTQIQENRGIALKTMKRHLEMRGLLHLYKNARSTQVRRKKGVTGKRKEHWDAVMADIRSGLSYNEVADKYGMDTRSKRKSLFRQLKEYDLWEAVKLRDGMKGPPAATPSQWLTILNRIIAGESIREAIGGLDMTRTAVNSFLKKFGTSPRRIKTEGLPPAMMEVLQQAIDIEPPRTNPWYWSY